MKATALALLASAVLSGNALAAGDGRPKGIPHLDHVFVIVMENHSYPQIIGNPNEPYLNQLIASGAVNLATNYYAVGHPSLTNYLEIVGGSNFGIRSDNSPNWHSATPCQPNIETKIPNADNGAGGTPPYPIDTGSVCPIAGSGSDATTEAVDSWNEVAPGVFNALANIDGVKSVTQAATEGKTIADQLAQAGMTWKSYQESLPLSGADGVNNSNGTASNLTPPSLIAPLTTSNIVAAYAVKHNPFAYFKSVQEGTSPELSLADIVGFDGPKGLYADLATGNVPNLAFIAPNQCNDQHGRGNADAFCAFDPGSPDNGGFTIGTQTFLNPGLILQGDVTIERLVNGIKASPAWKEGRNAIVIVWDENDYSGVLTAPSPGTVFPSPNTNRVVLTVETSDQRGHGISSGRYYTSFSLLKSLESGLGLPCLNHSCDEDVGVMSDLFAAHDN